MRTLFLGLLFISQYAFADFSIRFNDDRWDDEIYSGPVSVARYRCGLPNIYSPTLRAPREVCSTYEHPEHRSACQFAMRQARNMARYYAGAMGRRDGFLAGYSCGVNDGIDRNERDYREYNRGNQLTSDLSRRIESLVQSETVPEATRASDNQAWSRVRAQYRAATDAGLQQLPSYDDRAQVPSYSPITNGYESIGLRIPSIRELVEDLFPSSRFYLNERMFNPLSRDRYFDRFWREESRISYADLLTERRRYYSYDPDSYFEARRALDRWERWNGEYPEINIEYRKVSAEKIGVPVEKKVETIENGEKKIIVVIETHYIESPREIFKRAFVDAYQFLAPRFYQRQLLSSLDEGFDLGDEVGTATGLRLAFLTGERDITNTTAERRSTQVFADTFLARFPKDYNHAFETFKNNPVLESLQLSQLIGQIEDGIFTPGEAVKARFALSNIGGKSTDLTVQLNTQTRINTESGSGKWISKLKYAIDRLSKATFETEFFAELAKDWIALDKSSAAGSVSLAVNDQWTSRALTIQNPVMIHANMPAPLVDIKAGEIAVELKLENITTRTTTGEVALRLLADNKLVTELPLGFLPAQTQKSVRLAARGLDPLSFIGSTVALKIEMLVGGQVMQVNSTVTKAINQKSGLIEYFGYLVQKSAVMPEGVSWEQRVADISDRLVAEHKKEIEWLLEKPIERSAIWEKETSDATLTTLVRLKPNVDVAGQAVYTSLSVKLAEAAKKLRGGRGIERRIGGATGKAYERAIIRHHTKMIDKLSGKK